MRALWLALLLAAPAHAAPKQEALLLGLRTAEGLETWFVDGARVERLGAGQSESLSCQGAAHPTSSVELKFRPPAEDGGASIESVLGPEAYKAFSARWSAEAARNADCLLAEPDPKAWSLARARGHWTV